MRQEASERINEVTAEEPTCEVKTDDGDVCVNVATHMRESKLAPRYACEECVAALIDEGKVDHEVFREIADEKGPTK